jgi:AraC-like DNA-binding protein
MTALLGMLQNLVETGSGTLNKDVAKVFHTKWLVREQFSNPELNVKSIAAQLNCSPDYLSHLFHSETGEKLIQYIQRIRIDGAKMALETTQLYVSEIAFSSGFRDPAYFTRVFRKITGESPHEYRVKRDQDRLKSEEVPKTIYFDRDDYSHGQPRSK